MGSLSSGGDQLGDWEGLEESEPGLVVRHVWDLQGHHCSCCNEETREAGRELTGPSGVDLGEGLEDTTKDLANEVTLDIICNTIKVADGVLDGVTV